MVLNLNDYIYLISGTFGSYITYKFMRLFFDSSETNKRMEFFSYIIYFISISAIHLTINIPMVTLISNILLYFALSFNYKSTLKNRLISITLIYVILISIETIVLLLSGHIYDSIFSKKQLYLSIIGRITIHTISYIVVSVMNNYKYRKKDINIANVYWIPIFLIPLSSLSIILILLQAINLNTLSIITIIIVLLFINIVVFYSYDALNKIFQDRLEKLSLKEQNKYYKNELKIINNSYKNIRFLEHDMKNYLLALEGYIEKGEKEKALYYIHQVNNRSLKKKAFSKTGNIEIDSILNYKLQEAELKGILVGLEIKIPSIINISSSHLVVILGNLLDNAIEASSKVDGDKRIDIRIIYKNNMLFIYISNNFDGKVIYEGDRIITSKKNKEDHGVGLNSIRNILKKYDGDIKTYNTEDKFYVEVLMYIE